MEPHLEHTHGRHYDDGSTLGAGAATATHHTSHHGDNEDEHHGEKKSVIKKVKEKAKKLKNTITKHGHGHGDDDHHHHEEDDDDDDDDDEMEEDAEVHGAPMVRLGHYIVVNPSSSPGGRILEDVCTLNLQLVMNSAVYDSARAGPDAILAHPRGNLERPSVLAEDRYDGSVDSGARHGPPPLVSAGPYGTDHSKPSGFDQPRAHDRPDPFDPMVSRTHQGQPRGSIGKSIGMVEDPNAPKDPSRAGSDPSNYETKVTDPTRTGGKEAELSQIQHSFDKMGIHGEPEPKRFDSNHPENLPRDTLTGNPSSRSGSYVEKISTSASAMADKAADIIASKLGFPEKMPSPETHEAAKKPGPATEYAHKITDKVTETLAPVYEKVVDAGSSVISKVQGSVSSVSGQPQTQGSVSGQPQTVEKQNGADKGVSVTEYLAERLRPGDEDKALSEKITNAFHRGNGGESEKKTGEDRRHLGVVTESEEVRQRLGGVGDPRGVADRVKDAMGTWFGGNAPQGTIASSNHGDIDEQGLSNYGGGGNGQ
ncbi:hypothetical protein OSB04_026153 [Centaurea solstitialis]|uniref:Low-temperature-induced 65 kDa protein n=1 Tax=Centaurea solstitialis TaxID=347529 RepID=A0AA38VVC7_9ASTR|nr:hypothetical protein OSB04_026153 [Centaurea solstitialis]